jgi:hypothetical protein
MWAQTKGLLGEQVSFGGRGIRAFALGKTGDPEVWTKLTAEQQQWVMDTLVKLNNKIYQATGTSCPTWGPSIVAAGGCFQSWFNGAKLGLTNPDGSIVTLRTDGVFDQETLDALRTTVAIYSTDFPTPFPGTSAPGLEKQKQGLSTASMVGIGALGVTTVAGLIYAASTRKRGRKSRRK